MRPSGYSARIERLGAGPGDRGASPGAARGLSAFLGAGATISKGGGGQVEHTGHAAHAIPDAARAYTTRGRRVVPIPYRSKAPVLDGWQTLRLEIDDLSQYFNGSSNIGVL